MLQSGPGAWAPGNRLLFLFFFRGDGHPYRGFKAVLARHASWLGLQVVEKRFELPDGAAGGFFRLSTSAEEALPVRRSGSRVAATACGVPRAAAPDGFDPCASGPDTPARFELDGSTGELTVDVPLVSPDHVYYTSDGGSLAVGTDLRPLLRWRGRQPGGAGMASLLQYGTIPAPLTPYREIARVPCGHTLRCPAGEPSVRRTVPPIADWKRPVADGDVLDETARKLDDVLRDCPEGAVLFFSGGTDSGLLAARLSELDRHDVRLVHYAFGDDEEGAHAERMARHLEMPFRRIVDDGTAIPRLFDRIGRDYSFPFNDLSVLPTHGMILAASDELRSAGAALLGVGADDLYEGGLKIHSWSRVLRFPAPLRRLAVGLLGPLRPWLRDDRVHRVWGIGRRSLFSNHEFGPLLMHNDLAGIAYPRDSAAQLAVEDAWATSIDAFSAGLPAEDRLALIYLIHGGMGWEAPKFDPLRGMGVRSLYPFLDGAMLAHGFSLDWRQKCEGCKDKVLLKRLLARSVPSVMVERPKHGFSPPYREMLARDEIQDRFRAVLLEGPKRFFEGLDEPLLKRLLDRAHRGAPLNRSAANLLWTLFFVHSWLAQVGDESA